MASRLKFVFAILFIRYVTSYKFRNIAKKNLQKKGGHFVSGKTKIEYWF